MASVDPNKIIGWLQVGAILGGAFFLYKAYQQGKEAAVAAKEIITEDLNPASSQNVVYSLFDEKDKAGNVTSTLGTRIYDFFHPEEKVTIPTGETQSRVILAPAKLQ